MNLVKRVFLIVPVLFACVGCDQVTKTIARQTLVAGDPIAFVHDVFRLQYIENSGAFLSLGATTPEQFKYWVFVVFVGALLIGMLVFLITSRQLSTLQTVALSLLLAGGFGNLIDRIGNDGRVIDFMNVGIGTLRTGVFNVADLAITVGGMWFLIDALRRARKEGL